MKNAVKLSALAALAASAALMGASSAQAATNLVSDGTFSTPSVGGWGLFSNGQVGAWNNTNGDSLEVGNAGTYGLGCANTTCSVLEVNANTFDTVSQMITGLTVGKLYNVSWSYGGRPGGGEQKLDSSFGGAALTTDTGSYGAWTAESFKVKATGVSELLQFKSQVTSGLPSYGNVITNVSVAAVPEPATWAMMLMGLLGLGAVLRHSRKQTAAVATSAA